MSIISKAKHFMDGARILRDWLGSDARVVDQETAQRRANTCLACPMNVGNWSFTEHVALSIKEQVELKNSIAMRVDGEKNLHTCAACGCALKLKIWLPRDSIMEYTEQEELNAYDPGCWMRTELP